MSDKQVKSERFLTIADVEKLFKLMRMKVSSKAYEDKTHSTVIRTYDLDNIINEMKANALTEDARGASELMRMVSLLEQMRKERDKAQREFRRAKDEDEQNYFGGRADAFAKAVDLINQEAN